VSGTLIIKSGFYKRFLVVFISNGLLQLRIEINASESDQIRVLLFAFASANTASGFFAYIKRENFYVSLYKSKHVLCKSRNIKFI